MAYRRGGVFRSRFIAPVSQRATEILSKSLISQVTLAFDGGAANLAGNFTTGQIVSLAITAQSAVGQERLVIVGGLSASATADFTACTIDGQTATRVGTVQRGVGSGNRVFLTAYRAPGTSNTSIIVALTVGSASGGINNIYASCWKMSYAGNLSTQTGSSGNDPTLSLNTVAKGAVAGGQIGFGSGLFAGATDSFAWTGLTERYENHASSNNAFTSASLDIESASTPLAISVDITPNLTAGSTSKAGLTLSFSPIAARSVPANEGSFALTGADVGTNIGRFVTVPVPGAYTLTGTAATLRTGKKIDAAAGGYVLTGRSAAVYRSAGGNAALVFDATDTDATAKSSGTYTFPLTVAASPAERLVIVGGIAGTDGDFSAVTIDGQAGTRVGFASYGVADSSGYTPFLTAYRAPGTASTSINVVATIGGSLKTWTAAYAACFGMTGAGALYASTNNNTNDPILSSDVVINGAVAAALLGYADTTPTVTWAGLTERWDAVRVAGNDVFSGASIDVSTGVVPLFRSVAASTYGHVDTATVCTAPAGVANGDILIAAMHAGKDAGVADLAITPPAGWTQIGTRTVGADSAGFGAAFYVWWKRASGEGSSYSFLHTGSSTLYYTQVAIAAYSGCVPSGNPVDAFSSNSDSLSPVGALAPAITTTVGNTKLVYVNFTWKPDVFSDLLPPTGLTERYDNLVYVADKDFAGPGDTGNVVQDDVYYGPWSATLLALKPATSPRSISADITPDLATAGSDSVASIALSFGPSGAAVNRITADPGIYRLTGTPAQTLRGLKTVASPGFYMWTGSSATFQTSGQVIADPGSYVLTGRAVTLLRGGLTKRLDASPGAYVLTGADARVGKGRKITVTTVGSYLLTGDSPVLTGRGLIAAAGAFTLTGRNATPVKISPPNISISVSGNPMTASVNSVSASSTNGVTVPVTGNFMTASVGEETVAASGRVDVLIAVSGNLTTASVGNVSVSVLGGTALNVTGNEMTASVNSVTVKIPGVTTLTGNSMTASVGNVLVDTLGSVNVLLYGTYMTASTGDVTVESDANISVTGNEMTVSTGDVYTYSPLGIPVTGNSMTASVGTVTVSAKQNTVITVDGNAMVAYVGRLRFVGGGTIVLATDTTKEGQMLKPSNWMGG